MKRIVVVRAGALGDVVLTFPALTLLRRLCPEAQITAVGHPELWETAGDLIDSAESIDNPRFAGLYSDEPGNALRGWLKGVDLVVAWTARDPRPALERAGVVKMIHASPYPPPGVHAARWLVENLSPIAQCVASEEKNNRSQGTSIFIHPGAGAGWKRWPAPRFAAVGKRLREEGLRVVLVEGPADEDAVDALQEAAGAPFPVLRNLPPAALVQELKGGGLFIGNDSGVTHLAAWNGVPTIALFGPTDPASWAPIGDVQVLRGCERRATRQGEIRVCDDPDCMAMLPLERVVEAAIAVVSNDPSSGTQD